MMILLKKLLFKIIYALIAVALSIVVIVAFYFGVGHFLSAIFL